MISSLVKLLKYFVVILILFLSVLSYGQIISHRQQVERKELDNELSKIEENGEIWHIVNNLVDEDGYLYWYANINDIGQIRNTVSNILTKKNDFDTKYPRKSVQSLIKESKSIENIMLKITTVENKISLQNKVNSLFYGEKEFALKGNKINENVFLNHDACKETIENLIALSKNFEADLWLDSIQSLLALAEQQFDNY